MLTHPTLDKLPHRGRAPTPTKARLGDNFLAGATTSVFRGKQRPIGALEGRIVGNTRQCIEGEYWIQK